MIKYIGSKRRLIPVIAALASGSGARTGLDLFTGTTRVAQAFKEVGMSVTAVDLARYSEVFARCYIELDGDAIDRGALTEAIGHLNSLQGEPGYVTETFCRQSRFFQSFNGERIDAIREMIASEYRDTWLEPVLLTSLLEAADRVDSTVGVQMAYVKAWAPRSFKPLSLRVPDLLGGEGRAVRGDAVELTRSGTLGSFDLAYLDPPYNQHRYFTNYHVWETIVAWDRPEHYGVACKRVDARDPSTRSVFNSKRTMPDALGSIVADIDAELVIVSYNNESWIDIEDLEAMCSARNEVVTLSFASSRYVGARIGIHNPAGEKVGTVSHLTNREYVIVAGPHDVVRRAVSATREDLPKDLDSVA